MNTSKTARTTPATATLAASADQPDDDGRRRSSWPRPRGRRRFTKMPRSSARRMASPTVTSARSGPAYSRIMASWTMVSSRWVAGLSTGSRPLSATMTTRRAPQGEESLRCGQRPGVGEGGVDDGRQIRGVGGDRQRQDGDEQRRLGQGADGDRPARSHAPEGGAGVQAGQGQERRADRAGGRRGRTGPSWCRAPAASSPRA